MLNRIFLFQNCTKKGLVTSAVMILCFPQVSTVNHILIVPGSALNIFQVLIYSHW